MILCILKHTVPRIDQNIHLKLNMCFKNNQAKEHLKTCIWCLISINIYIRKNTISIVNQDLF